MVIHLQLLILIGICLLEGHCQTGKTSVPREFALQYIRVFYPRISLVDEEARPWRLPGLFSKDFTEKDDYTAFSKAQDQEDVWLYENWWYGYTNGVILESGALNGDDYSTSFLFEKFASWNAINVEADPRNFQGLMKNRPYALNIHAALCSSSRTLHFTNQGGHEVRGFVEFMTPLFLRKFHNKIYKNITKLDDLPAVQCVKTKRLLDEIGVREIDIWILDTEGSELSVLQGTDFSTVAISTIVMECDRSSPEKDREKVDLLQGKGYQCEQVLRNCFCKHSSFIPSSKPAEGRRHYTGIGSLAKRKKKSSTRTP